MLSKESWIFKKIYNKRLDKIDEFSEKINYGDLKFIVKRSDLGNYFSELRDPAIFLDSIKRREILIEEAQHKREEFNRYLKQ